MLGRSRPGEAGSASVSPVARPKPGLFVAFCREARDVRRTPRRRSPAQAGATVKNCAPGWLTRSKWDQSGRLRRASVTAACDLGATEKTKEAANRPPLAVLIWSVLLGPNRSRIPDA